jgi:hypothetical protein
LTDGPSISVSARGGGGDLGQLALVASSHSPRLRARSSAKRVLADDEPLAGVVGVRDLGEVLLVEERELQGAAGAQGPESPGRAAP